MSHRYSLLALFGLLTVLDFNPVQANPSSANMRCGQADPHETQMIFNRGDFANGANPGHHHYKAAAPPMITELANHTCIARFPVVEWNREQPDVPAVPAGEVTVQLEIVYLPCDILKRLPPYTTVAPNTPNACAFIHLRFFPDA
jgi:hypothetical protein